MILQDIWKEDHRKLWILNPRSMYGINSQNQPNVGRYTSRMDAMGMEMNGTFELLLSLDCVCF